MTTLFESAKWAKAKEVLLAGSDLDTNQDGSLNTTRRGNLEIVLENTRKHVLKEAVSAGGTGAANVDSINKLLPVLLRRVLPSVIANEIMGVQAMHGPVAQIMTFRAKYGEAMGAAGAPGSIVAGAEALSPYNIAKAYSGNFDPAAPAAADTATLEGTMGRKIGAELIRETVTAKSRRLQARWTIEAAQDAKNEYSFDIESEMLNVLAAEMVAEVDQEMLFNLRSVAAAPTLNFDMAAANITGQPTFVGDVHASLATMINYQANQIAARTRRGAGNWIVVSPTALTILQSAKTSGFARTVTGDFEAPVNTKFVGMLNGAQKVYVDQYADASTDVLVGLKASDAEAAAYYCPYIPLMGTGTMTDPNTGELVTGFLTRYGYLALTANPATKSFQNAADYLGRIGITSANLKWM